VNVPETFPFSLSGTAGTVRGRRSETGIPFRATVRPPVSSNDHYEGSTRQRPVTNYILLAQSRPARTYTMRVLPRERRYTGTQARVRARARARGYVTGRAVRWRKSKSLGRLKASLRRSSWLEFLPRFPWKASTERIGGGACRLSSPRLTTVLVPDEAGRPAKSSAHVRDPVTSRGSSFTRRGTLKTLRGVCDLRSRALRARAKCY